MAKGDKGYGDMTVKELEKERNKLFVERDEVRTKIKKINEILNEKLRKGD